MASKLVMDSTRRLQLRLSLAVTANESSWCVSGLTTRSGAVVGSGETDGTDPVTVVAAPASGLVNAIDRIDVTNLDTGPTTFILEMVATTVVGGETVETTSVVVSHELAPGASINLIDAAAVAASGTGTGGGGDMYGPDASVAHNFAAFAGASGKVLEDSGKKASDFANASHAHAGSDVTSGTVAAARLGTMTGDSGTGGASGAAPAPSAGDAAAGKFLKANGTWAVPPGLERWTAFTGFNAAAACKCGLILTSAIPTVDTLYRIPLRYKCTGDSTHRYGMTLYAGGDVTKTPHSGTARAGGLGPITVLLGATASGTNGYYNGMVIEILSGTGAGQRAIVSSYDGATQTATLQVYYQDCMAWNVAADTDSVYTMYHALIAGAPLNAASLTEMAYGRPEQIGLATMLIPGVYSDQAADTTLFHTLAGGYAAWQVSPAHVVAVTAYNKTNDTGTPPVVNVCAASDAPLLDNAGDGIVPSGDIPPKFSEPGNINFGHEKLGNGGFGALETYLTVPGGNGDAADLTVSIYFVME